METIICCSILTTDRYIYIYIYNNNNNNNNNNLYYVHNQD